MSTDPDAGAKPPRQKYTIVHTSCPRGLEQEVNLLLAIGWRLHGVTLALGGKLHQALVFEGESARSE